MWLRKAYCKWTKHSDVLTLFTQCSLFKCLFTAVWTQVSDYQQCQLKASLWFALSETLHTISHYNFIHGFLKKLPICSTECMLMDPCSGSSLQSSSLRSQVLSAVLQVWTVIRLWLYEQFWQIAFCWPVSQEPPSSDQDTGISSGTMTMHHHNRGTYIHGKRSYRIA